MSPLVMGPSYSATHRARFGYSAAPCAQAVGDASKTRATTAKRAGKSGHRARPSLRSLPLCGITVRTMFGVVSTCQAQWPHFSDDRTGGHVCALRGPVGRPEGANERRPFRNL